MPVGWLQASVKLDQPGLIHCGSEEPVTGRILLRYTSPQNTELFGPLLITVIFHGRAKTKVYKSNGQTRSTYRGRAALFSRTFKIYDDAFRSQHNETHDFPFSVRFPEQVERPSLDDSIWDSDGKFNVDPRQPLPPSCVMNYRGFGGHFEAFVEYRIGCEVRMPRIDVTITTPDKYAEPVVLYERPRLPESVRSTPFDFRACINVQNELLLPEEDRPQGFRQKAKAAFSSDYYPRYSFDWYCRAPREMHVGHPIAFEVRIKPRENECTAVVVPDVTINDFNVYIVAEKCARADKVIFRSPQSSGDSTIASFRGLPEDSTPFGKSSDWTKQVNIRELNKVTSTFQTFNIGVAHRMKISLSFSVAGKIKETTREFPILILPPVQTRAASGLLSSQANHDAVQAGPSSGMASTADADVALPQYDRPPEYDRDMENDCSLDDSHWKEKARVNSANVVAPSLR